MSTIFAIPTLAGQAAIAAAIDPEDPVPIVISEMVVGDGNGQPITPLETMTALVNQRAVVPVASTSRNGNQLTIDGILDETIGGFTIHEAGILDEDGVLLFIASVPATDKVTNQPNIQDILTLGMVIVVSDTAQVFINVDGITYATHDYVNQAIANLRTNIGTPLFPYHITVQSMALAAPPASPTPGHTWIVAPDATGAWAGHSGKLAQYLGSEDWSFVTVPVGHVVANAATGLLMQRIGSSWIAVLPATPGQTAWLQSTSAGVKSWTDPFNINGLTARAIVDADEVAFHAIAVNGKRKTTLGALADAIAVRVANSDYIHSEMRFLRGR